MTDDPHFKTRVPAGINAAAVPSASHGQLLRTLELEIPMSRIVRRINEMMEAEKLNQEGCPETDWVRVEAGIRLYVECVQGISQRPESTGATGGVPPPLPVEKNSRIPVVGTGTTSPVDLNAGTQHVESLDRMRLFMRLEGSCLSDFRRARIQTLQARSHVRPVSVAQAGIPGNEAFSTSPQRVAHWRMAAACLVVLGAGAGGLLHMGNSSPNTAVRTERMTAKGGRIPQSSGPAAAVDSRPAPAGMPEAAASPHPEESLIDAVRPRFNAPLW